MLFFLCPVRRRKRECPQSEETRQSQEQRCFQTHKDPNLRDEALSQNDRPSPQCGGIVWPWTWLCFPSFWPFAALSCSFHSHSLERATHQALATALVPNRPSADHPARSLACRVPASLRLETQPFFENLRLPPCTPKKSPSAIHPRPGAPEPHPPRL